MKKTIKCDELSSMLDACFGYAMVAAESSFSKGVLEYSENYRRSFISGLVCMLKDYGIEKNLSASYAYSLAKVRYVDV